MAPSEPSSADDNHATASPCSKGRPRLATGCHELPVDLDSDDVGSLLDQQLHELASAAAEIDHRAVGCELLCELEIPGPKLGRRPAETLLEGRGAEPRSELAGGLRSLETLHPSSQITVAVGRRAGPSLEVSEPLQQRVDLSQQLGVNVGVGVLDDSHELSKYRPDRVGERLHLLEHARRLSRDRLADGSMQCRSTRQAALVVDGGRGEAHARVEGAEAFAKGLVVVRCRSMGRDTPKVGVHVGFEVRGIGAFAAPALDLFSKTVDEGLDIRRRVSGHGGAS